MKKVLHIIDSMWLWWAQTVVKWIFEWQKDNHDIYTYALRKRDINIEIEHRNIFSDTSKNKFNFPILKLKKFIIDNEIEVLHRHLAKSQIMWFLLKKIFFSDIKLILHEHGQILEKWKIYPFLMNIFRQHVDIYIAVSRWTKESILNKTAYKKDKIHILYNYVDLDKFKKIDGFNLSLERKKYWVTEKDYVIGFASRLVEDKWWKEFTSAAKILSKKYPNMKFIIWGDGIDKEKIQDYITKNHLSEKIFLVWYIQDMPDFYNCLDCFVFPSHRESLWLTWLEANACWCPVVASDIPGLNELMIDEDNALLFDVWNSKILQEKILLIIEDASLRDRIIWNGRKKVKEFNLEKYIINLNKIYG